MRPTIHPRRVTETAKIMPNQISSYATEVRKELRGLREVEIEKIRPITQPHEIPVPRRSDAIDANRQMSVIKPTDELRRMKRLHGV